MVESLGGVNEAEVAKFTADSAPPEEAGASPLTRFVRRVATLVSVRVGRGEDGQVAVFLQSEALCTDIAGQSHSESPLLANGNDPITNRVWMATASLGTAYALDIEWGDLANLYKAIRDAGLGNMPALVVDWRGPFPIGRLHPSGVDRAEEVSAIDFAEEPISPEGMKDALDHFYESSLRTPALIVEGHGMRVWEDPRKGVPAERPEERIHGRLMDSLRGRFSRHFVRAEVFNPEGRIDIVVWSKTTDSVGRRAVLHEWILELKALADKTHNGNPIGQSASRQAVSSGLVQASAYQAEVHALRAALCCFDMRTQDEADQACFAHIVTEAAARNVLLWRWFLFRETADAREVAHGLQ